MTAIILIFSILYLIYLTHKVNRLEKKIDDAALGKLDYPSQLIASDTQAQSGLASAQAPSIQPTQQAAQPAPSSGPTAGSRFIQWLTTDWLLKLGAVLLLLGLAWFVSYAFAENWIGPMGRIALGFVFGSTLLIFGEWRGRHSEVQGTIFMGVGAAAVLLTTYAARTAYDMFDPFTATLIMLAAIVLMSLSSVMHQSQNRAVLSLLLAAMVPFFTASPDTSVVGLLSYGFIIIAGTIWVVSMTQWRLLTALALCVYGIYSMMVWGAVPIDDQVLTRVLVFAFGLLFYATALIAHIRVEGQSKREYFVSLGNALLLSIWIYQVVPEHLLSLTTSGVALLFFVGAFVASKFSQKTHVVLEYVAVALALLAAAATFELEGPALSITYSALVSAGIFLVLQLNRQLRSAQAVGLLFIPVFLHSIVLWQSNMLSYSSISQPIRYDHLIIWWVLVLEIFAIGYYFYRSAMKQQLRDAVTISAAYLIAGTFLGLFALWHQLEAIVANPDTAHSIALIISTLVGIVVYFVSRVNAYKKSTYTGAAVLGFVVLRLLFVEVWSMDLVPRVIVFSLIGLLLMSTAFVKPRKDRE